MEKLRRAKRRNFLEVHEKYEYDPNLISIEQELENHYKSPFDLLSELKQGIGYNKTKRSITEPIDLNGSESNGKPISPLTFMKKIEKSER